MRYLVELASKLHNYVYHNKLNIKQMSLMYKSGSSRQLTADIVFSTNSIAKVVGHILSLFSEIPQIVDIMFNIVKKDSYNFEALLYTTLYNTRPKHVEEFFQLLESKYQIVGLYIKYSINESKLTATITTEINIHESSKKALLATLEAIETSVNKSFKIEYKYVQNQKTTYIKIYGLDSIEITNIIVEKLTSKYKIEPKINKYRNHITLEIKHK